MPVPPRIDVLDTSAPIPSEDVKTPGSSKSMKFKSLFRWRKTASAMPRPKTHSGLSPTIDNSPGLPSQSLLPPRPSVAVRSHSEHDVHRKPQTTRLTRRRDRARHITTTDPPPFMQAHSFALLHASLESPTSFSDKSLSRRNSISSKTNNGTALPESHVEVKRSHKRTASGESTCTLKEKVFYLTADGHILQYDGDGGGDRLPEKILELGDESVAFASDAVPGHRWVLQITRNGTGSKHENGQALRPKWSKLTLRNVESKRTVDTLLLVFGDPEDLYTWLFAVRKEIEQFGGMEYRPDTEEDDQSWRDELAKTYGGETNILPVGSELDSSVDPKAFSASKTSSDTARLVPVPARTRSMLSTASSTASATSLNRLRDSVTSDGYPSTVATSSAEGSLPATSPTVDSFPPSKQHGETPNSGASSPQLSSMNDALAFRISSLSTPPVSIQERRKLSVTNMQPQRDTVTPSLASIASANKTSAAGSSSLTDRPMSTVAPLAKTLSGRRSLHAMRHKPNTETTSASPDAPDGRPPSSFRRPSRRNGSVSESLSDDRKPKYSLFPVRAHDNKPEITVSPAPNPIPSIHLSERTSEGKDREVKKSEAPQAHRKTRSRTLTLNLPSYQVAPGLLSPLNTDFSKPQRSPAVTDAMIMSNFGAFSLEPQPSSPLPDINVPGLKDLSMDLDFLKTPPPPQKRSRSPLSKKKVSPTKSMPNMLNESSVVARAPVGPPPSGPLPAVPVKHGARPSSRGRPSVEPEGRRRSSGTSCRRDAAPVSTSQALQPTPENYPKEVPIAKKQQISHKHSRTISNSNDGPPPPPRSSSFRPGHGQPRMETLTS